MLHPDASASFSDPVALLGKPLADPAVLALIGERAERCYGDAVGHVACPTLGVDFALDREDRIRWVQLYPNAAGHYRSYAGALPFALDRADTRDRVVSKLGRPEKTTADLDVFATRGLRVLITYYEPPAPQAGLIRHLEVSRAP